MKRAVSICLANDLTGVNEAIIKQASQVVGRLGTKVELKFQEASLEKDNNSQVIHRLEQSDVALIDTWEVNGWLMQNIPRRVKWVQSLWAGLDNIVQHNSKPHYILTRFGGKYRHSLSEYTLAAVLAMKLKLPNYIRNNVNKEWIGGNCFSDSYRSLDEMTIGILGVGDIGSTVARLCRSCGMSVLGLVSTPRVPDALCERYYMAHELPEMLRRCDFVCNILPSTAGTRHMLTADLLSNCAERKPGFVNIGRGDVMREQTLIEALNKGWISSAFLDVFEKEPLPLDSELWRMENVTVTPHIGAITRVQDVVDMFYGNLELFLTNQPLKYQFDWDRRF